MLLKDFINLHNKYWKSELSKLITGDYSNGYISGNKQTGFCFQFVTEGPNYTKMKSELHRLDDSANVDSLVETISLDVQKTTKQALNLRQESFEKKRQVLDNLQLEVTNKNNSLIAHGIDLNIYTKFNIKFLYDLFSLDDSMIEVDFDALYDKSDYSNKFGDDKKAITAYRDKQYKLDLEDNISKIKFAKIMQLLEKLGVILKKIEIQKFRLDNSDQIVQNSFEYRSTITFIKKSDLDLLVQLDKDEAIKLLGLK